MTKEEFIREYRGQDNIKGAIVEEVVEHYIEQDFDRNNTHPLANDIICSTWKYPEYYNLFNEFEEEIQATVGRKSLSAFLMGNGVGYDRSLQGCNSMNLNNLCEVVVISKVKEIQEDFKKRVAEEKEEERDEGGWER